MGLLISAEPADVGTCRARVDIYSWTLCPPTIKRRLVCVCLVWLTGHTIASAQYWPQFRGTHTGLAADDSSLPDTWGETQNVAWKVDIPGRDWSSGRTKSRTLKFARDSGRWILAANRPWLTKPTYVGKLIALPLKSTT